MGACAQLFFLLTRALKPLFSKGFASPRVGGTDFVDESRSGRGRPWYQNVLVATFCPTDHRNVCFRHAKCMSEELSQSFVGGPIHRRRCDPHEEPPVAYSVNALT